MKKLYLLLFTVWSGISIGQMPDLERCMTPQAILHQDAKTPGYADLVREQFELAKNTPVMKSDEEYVIPVVFHIVWNSPQENLADSIIHRQIELLNQDFGRKNPDTINMREDFDIVKGNPRIQFKLATIDPDGNPTTGITRTQTNKTSFFDLSFLTAGFDVLEEVKQTDNGGMDPWNQERYLNIWVCNMSFLGQTFLLGYATPPDGLPNWPQGTTDGLSDGVVVQYQTVGDNNPNMLDMGQGAIEVKGRTVTHEIGHYLGLRHIWGDGDCAEDDGIDDTPNADDQSNFDCDDTKNTCVDDIFGIDLPDMIENYMDYSAETCQNSFTKGQAMLMRSVLENQREKLINNNPANIAEAVLPDFSIYPNPFDNDVTISIKNGKMDYLELRDVTGKLILEEKVTKDIHHINTSHLQKGVYIVSFKNSGQQLGSRKIVKH